MFLVASNNARRLLHLSYIGRVSVEELQEGSEELVALLAELPAGLQILVDLERLEAMDIGCAKIVGKMMELYTASDFYAYATHNKGENAMF